MNCRNPKTIKRRAAVIGGSIAGMLAARVLADSFEEVVIIEADELPEGIEPRKRTPQANHSHVLLQRGQTILERLFPGLIQQCIDAGSVTSDFTRDLSWFHFGQWKPRFASGIRVVQQTRPFLERHIRSRLQEYDNVQFLTRTKAAGLILSPDGSRAEGLKLVSAADGQAMPELLCDLTVDAGGAGSPCLKWLQSQPAEESLTIDLFYATRFYRDPEPNNRNWTNLMISAWLPDQPYAGVVLSFENGLMGVTLGGYKKEPPTTIEDFGAIAASLPQPDISRFLQRAEPVSDMHVYRIPSQSRKRIPPGSLPRRLLPIGDAFCRFDPLYGQGMSVAAIEAERLGELLRADGADLDAAVHQYLSALPTLTQEPWDMALTEALRHPDIASGQGASFVMKLMQRFTERIYAASAQHKDVYLALAQAMNLTASSRIFFRPSLLGKIMTTRPNKGNR